MREKTDWKDLKFAPKDAGKILKIVTESLNLVNKIKQNLN